MGPWVVFAGTVLVLAALVLGVVALVRARRRRRPPADRPGDDEVLRAQVLEHLRQVQRQWDGEAADGAPDEQPAPVPATPPPPAPADRPSRQDVRAGPAHGARSTRRGDTVPRSRVLPLALLLGAVVGAVVIWVGLR